MLHNVVPYLCRDIKKKTPACPHAESHPFHKNLTFFFWITLSFGLITKGTHGQPIEGICQGPVSVLCFCSKLIWSKSHHRVFWYKPRVHCLHPVPLNETLPHGTFRKCKPRWEAGGTQIHYGEQIKNNRGVYPLWRVSKLCPAMHCVGQKLFCKARQGTVLQLQSRTAQASTSSLQLLDGRWHQKPTYIYMCVYLRQRERGREKRISNTYFL